MTLSVTNTDDTVDIVRDAKYFAMNVDQRVEFLTEAQRLINSLLNAELEVFTEQLAAVLDNAKHSQ